MDAEQTSTVGILPWLRYGFLHVQAHNGSGKTTCFVLAMLSRVDPELAQPQALCVCPTRYAAFTQSSICTEGRHCAVQSAELRAAGSWSRRM